MVFASPTTHFCPISISGQGLTPTMHVNVCQESRIPTLETNPELLHPVAKTQNERMLPRHSPCHSVQPISQSFGQLLIHFLSKELIHLLSGCSGMAFSLRKPSRFCLDSWALWGPPVLSAAFGLYFLVLCHNRAPFTEPPPVHSTTLRTRRNCRKRRFPNSDV